MKAYRTREFSRLARKAKVTDKELRAAVRDIVAGRIDAHLGAYLIKQRVSEGQGGRANSQRAIIVTKDGDRIVFVHLFAKNTQQNLRSKELELYRSAAKIIAGLDDAQVTALVSQKEWIEVEDAPQETRVSE